MQAQLAESPTEETIQTNLEKLCKGLFCVFVPAFGTAGPCAAEKNPLFSLKSTALSTCGSLKLQRCMAKSQCH